MSLVDERLLKIVRSLGVKQIKLAKNLDYSYADCPKATIVIGLKNVNIYNENELLSTVFHEAAHVINYNTGKYYKYHRGLGGKRYLRSIALKAERYTDKVGARLMKKYYPNVSYLHGYDTDELQDWLRSYYK